VGCGWGKPSLREETRVGAYLKYVWTSLPTSFNKCLGKHGGVRRKRKSSF